MKTQQNVKTQQGMKVQLNEKQKSIHEQGLNLTVRHEENEYDRIENLIDAEANDVHKAFGKKMFTYATDVLKIDPTFAYPYIGVARACVKFPKLRNVLRAKSLTVTKAGRIVSTLNKENADELIHFAQTHSKRAIEDEVVRRNPKARTRDRIRSINSELDEIRVTVKKDVSKNFKRVQALNPSRNMAEILETMIEFYLDRKDPVRKAQRAQSRAENPSSAGPKPADSSSAGPKAADSSFVGPKPAAPNPSESTSAKPNSAGASFAAPNSTGTIGTEPVSRVSNCTDPTRTRPKKYARAENAMRVAPTAKQKHSVHARDLGCCTFIDTSGKRCGNDRWIEIHHLIRVCDGGTNEPTNLTTLCSFHHDLVHQLSLPIDGQVNWLR